MATNYFEMMQDVVGSYGEGAELGLKRKRQKADDDRKTVMQGREDEAYNQVKAQRDAENTAVADFGRMKTLGIPNQSNIDANTADWNAAGSGMAGPSQAPARPEYTPASDLQLNQGMQGIMRAKRDWNAAYKLQGEEKDLKFDEAYQGHLKSFDGSADQVKAAVENINQLSGSLSMGVPDKQGVVRFSVVQPDKTAVFGKLSLPEQKQLWAAGQMLEQNPTKALALIATVNKDLAASIARENNLTSSVGTGNNSAATSSNTMKNQDARTGIAARSAANAETRANASAARQAAGDWQIIGATQDGKGLQQFNKLTGQMRVMPVPEGADAAGLFRRLTGDKAGAGQGLQNVPDEGKVVRDPQTGKIYTTDGRGGYVAEGGVPPSQQTGWLTANGIPDNVVGKLRFTPAGNEIVAPNGMAYGLDEVPQLVADLKKLGRNSAEVDELQRLRHADLRPKNDAGLPGDNPPGVFSRGTGQGVGWPEGYSQPPGRPLGLSAGPQVSFPYRPGEPDPRSIYGR